MEEIGTEEIGTEEISTEEISTEEIGTEEVIEELYENEQYFYDEKTLSELTDFLARWETPCCLCTPLLGQWMSQHSSRNPTILDMDRRFACTSGFRYYDLNRPEWLDQEFDIIVCDPPFFNVSLGQLYHAVRLLSHFRFDQPLLISYLRRRSNIVMDTFSQFGLRPVDYSPGYQTVQSLALNDIVFYSNLPDDLIAEIGR